MVDATVTANIPSFNRQVAEAILMETYDRAPRIGLRGDEALAISVGQRVQHAIDADWLELDRYEDGFVYYRITSAGIHRRRELKTRAA